MSSGATHPHLRLTGADDAASRTEWSQRENARLAVIKENRVAAYAPALDPRDPRWRLAMQTQAQLQGTTLSPERRDALMRDGRKLGLRPFETNLVIAVVQDRARRGEAASTGTPVLRLASDQTEFGCADRRRLQRWSVHMALALRWFAALAAAAGTAIILARWFVLPH